MDVELKFDCAGVDWTFVSDTLRRVGMASRAPELHRKAFEASHTVVFAYVDGRPVGFGRAISDGAVKLVKPTAALQVDPSSKLLL